MLRNITIVSGLDYDHELLNEILSDSIHDNFSIVDFDEFFCIIHFRDIEVIVVNDFNTDQALTYFKEYDEEAYKHLYRLIEGGKKSEDWEDEL